MQLVVMATMLAVAGAGHDCSIGCHPTNISIEVESCGIVEHVYTTICEGQCFHRDPVYIGFEDWAEQNTCNGDWSYEVKHIRGCPIAVTYPVARSCECSACNPGNTFCGPLAGDVQRCMSF